MPSALPRVTSILKLFGLGPDLSKIPEDVLGAACVRGTAVHEAIEAHSYGYYDGGLAPEYQPYFDAYLSFLADTKPKLIVSEIELVNSRWRYIGHPDWVGWLDPKRVLIDFKSGGAKGVVYQLAAYVDLWNTAHPTEPITEAAALCLRRNGTYRYVPENPVDLKAATTVWHAALTVLHARGGK